jgi:orotate phosphoribosyltransferase-like protein
MRKRRNSMRKITKRELEKVFELKMQGLTNREITEETKIPIDELRTAIQDYVKYREHTRELSKKYNMRRV